jgi:hypothetical protein
MTYDEKPFEKPPIFRLNRRKVIARLEESLKIYLFTNPSKCKASHFRAECPPSKRMVFNCI